MLQMYVIVYSLYVQQSAVISLLCFVEATSSYRMSVGFIGAGQLAHALVKGFTAAGEKGTLPCLHYTFNSGTFAILKQQYNHMVQHLILVSGRCDCCSQDHS